MACESCADKKRQDAVEAEIAGIRALIASEHWDVLSADVQETVKDDLTSLEDEREMLKSGKKEF